MTKLFEWDGVTKSYTINDDRNNLLQELFESAKCNSWDNVIRIIKDHSEFINSNQPDMLTGYTLLHYAAISKDLIVMDELIKLGAWRSVKCNRGKQPVDLIEINADNSRIIKKLTPVMRQNFDIKELDMIQKLLNRLIYEITEGLAEKHELRLPQLQVLLEIKEPSIWFPVPGMYGGFNLSLLEGNKEIKLISESWSRIVDESGKRYEITSTNIRLLEEGFV